jgi:HK97 family phage portal protein
MGIFSSLSDIFGRRRPAPFTDAINRLPYFGTRTRAGTSVTLESSLKLSAVFACVRVISEGLAQTPLQLFQVDAAGNRRRDTAHPAARVLTQTPNDIDNAFEFIESVAMHVALRGNAYCAILRGVRGDIVSLLPLRPEWVTHVIDDSSRRLKSYRVNLLNKNFDISLSDMWHIRGPAWAQGEGLDLIETACEAVGLGIATEEFASRLFSQGIRPGGILTVPDFMPPEKLEAFQEAWMKANEGGDRAMSTIFMHGGAKFERLSMTSDEAQFIETRRFMIEEVCRFWRVLPIMVGSADKVATYSSSEQMFLAHVVHTMVPWFRRFEASINRHLLTEADRAVGYYFKFNASALMRGAATDRAQFYSAALGAGGSPAWMTQDEVRQLEDLNPLGGTAAALPVASTSGTNTQTGGGAQ